jgi:transcriptional regulator
MEPVYVPHFNQMPHDEVRGFVAAVGTAQLITVGEDGAPDATFLPVLWDGDTVVGHLARANPHWRRIVEGAPGLVVVTGPDAYVSPGWYATKREHGKVVPTWNYSAVQLRGTVRVIDDTEWLRHHVSALTDRHEAERDQPWAVTDAPEKYVAGQLRAVVGVELRVTDVDAKAKLSQNRSAEDRAGVVAGLGDHPVARTMERATRAQEPIRDRTS